MEPAPFSHAGLEPEQLEKEAAIVEKSVEAVQEAVDGIDYQVIDDILLGIFKKAYPNLSEVELKEKFSFDGRYDITVKYSEKMEHENYGSGSDLNASAYAQGDKIAILAREFVDDQGNLNENSESGLLKVSIHEIMHNKSHSADQYQQTKFSGIAPMERVTDNGTPFIHLNEALTEIIADAVHSEYLARTGIVSKFDKYESGYKQPVYRHAVYLNERLALERLVLMLQEESGMDRERIYQALTVEYFKNGDLGRSEIIDTIDSERLKEFLEKIETNDGEILRAFSGDEIQTYNGYLHWYQQQAITGIVGRDYIGAVNWKRASEIPRPAQPTNLEKLWIFLKNNF